MHTNHFKLNAMDQLDFLTALIQEPETKYIARPLHEKYKQFNADGNYGNLMTETMFGRKMQEINGVTKTKSSDGRMVYQFDKVEMQKHLEVLSFLKRADDGNRAQKRKHKLETEEEQRAHQRELKRLQEEEEDRQRKIIEEQEEKCRKVMVEYAHGDNLTRLTIEPSLHRMLVNAVSSSSLLQQLLQSQVWSMLVCTC